MRLFTSLFHAALAFFGYLGIHYAFAYTLPLPTAGYTICANLTAVAVSAAIFCWQKRRPLQTAGLHPIRLTNVFAALGAGVGLSLLVRLAMLTITVPEAWSESYAERVELVSQSPVWLRYLSSIAVAPFAEEWVFRGLIYRRFRAAMPRIAATVLTSLLFAVLHGTIVWMLYTFVLGAILCVLRERTRSLWACIACHIAFNIMGQIPLWSALPDAVVIGIFVVGTVVFIAAMWYVLRRNVAATPPPARRIGNSGEIL